MPPTPDGSHPPPRPGDPSPVGETLVTRAGTAVPPDPDSTLTGPPPDQPGFPPPGAVGPEAPAGAPVRTVGGYEILGELGRGGMGVVYKARHAKLGRLVALKMIRSAAHASAAEVARFLAEARAEARLDHVNIIPVFEIGEADGLPFFAMALVEGGSLSQRLADGPLPPRVSARVMQQVAEAIQHAHERGVLHRDLKPQNILLQADNDARPGASVGGRSATASAAPESSSSVRGEAFPIPKVSDFGLSRLIGQDSLTATGEVLGTPSYMPPEQAAGLTREVGPHSDVYSLGAVLYSLLTGRPPFQAATLTETLRQVREQDPAPPRRLNSAVPRDLETVCLKCLEKEPARRYASASALAEDLRRFVAGEPILAVPASVTTQVSKWVRRRPVVAGLTTLVVIVSLLGIGSFVWAYGRTLREIEHARAEAARADAQARRANELLVKANEANRQRIRTRVEQLRTAAPQAVGGLLKDLDGERSAARPYLDEAWADGAADGDAPGRIRAALALLPERPDLRDTVARWMLSADDPREMLLARDALTPYSADLSLDLWKRATDMKLTPAARFRALVALAAFDPADGRWRQAGDAAAEQLLKANPLFLDVWTQALRPASNALIPPLSTVFRRGARADQRLVATNVLAEYGRDDPALLADLVADARPDQFAALFPALERHRSAATERLTHELAVTRRPSWNDKPAKLSLAPVPPETVRELENAGGVVADRFALCQELPGGRAAAVVETLKQSGYRPVNYRPYLAMNQPYVAAVWTRDGLDFRLLEGATAEEVRKADAGHQSHGFVPLDVTPQPAANPPRYTVLWVQRTPGVVEGRLFVGVERADHDATWQPLQKAGFAPVTQVECDAAGRSVHNAVWWKRARPYPGDNYNLRYTESEYEDNLTIGSLQTDVRLLRVPGPAAAGRLATSQKLLDESEAALAKAPDNDNAHWQAALALCALDHCLAALPHLDRLIAKYPTISAALRQRALARARVGDADGARADLRAFGALNVGAAEAELLAVRVGALSGEHSSALKQLDAVSSENRGDPSTLYAAAEAAAFAAFAASRGVLCTSGTAAGVGASAGRMCWYPGRADVAATYAARAIPLLEEAVAAGFRDFARLATDDDFDFLRPDPAFQGLVARGHLDRHYSAVWHQDPALESVESHGLTPDAHRARMRTFVADGWRPVSLCVGAVGPNGSPVTASVWQRPRAGEADRATQAHRRSNAAMGLLRLAPGGGSWSVLSQTATPDARSYLVRDLAPCGVSVAAVLERLNETTDVAARRALILALGEFSEEQLSAETRASQTPKLLHWYRHDPDAGVHGAIDWLLRHNREGITPRPIDWGQATALAAIDKVLAGAALPAGQTWCVAKGGFTMTVVPGPVDFQMGSLATEPDRSEDETRHVRRIVRSFAIAAKDVTVAQYKAFLRAAPPGVPPNYAEGTSPEEDCPVNGIDWYMAAKYCRWLSEQEGLPESEMCYPPMAEIKEGMKLSVDFRAKHGYRLPSEAEWEYACRAGSESTRCFGADAELLPRYGWFIRNANDRTWPVGQKRPNDLGMFDMHGCLWNWCQDRYRAYGGGGYRTDDDPDLGRAMKETDSRVQRGGTFDSQPNVLRCAYRNANRPSLRILSVGLRVARTFSPPPVPPAR